MAGLILKRPFVGFAVSIIFGSLGMLLIRSNPSIGPQKDRVQWLFGVVGYFALFVALRSLMSAVHAVWVRKNARR